VGSGATAQNARELLAVADGLIVGTAIKEGGRTTAPVDLERARAFAGRARD
jgi:predicted TIM-barrel enzyme